MCIRDRWAWPELNPGAEVAQSKAKVHWRAARKTLTVAAMQARALAADVRLEVDTPESLPAPRDVAALQLVLRNLLDNAVKFSPPNATVHISLAKKASEAHIVVRDAGRGLDHDELTHAFEPFFRGDDKASGGTGLGLHLVQEMIHSHGGSVTAESAGRDQGSSFTVRLPLEQTS